MTVQELMDRVDALRPNAYSETLKLAWINDLELRLQTEAFLRGGEELVTHTDIGEELLAHRAYQSLYESYLMAKLSLMRGEYDSYRSEQAVFDDALRSYMKWYSLNLRPAERG